MSPIRFRRLLTPLCATLAAACAIEGPGPSPSKEIPRRPNVVIVTVDTLRADRVGVYGSTTSRTPAIDALAASAALFQHAYAPLPKTNPSLCSLMTGRYPSAHGVRRNGAYLPESELTLAELLRAAGYRTSAFISNHVMHSRHGLAQGFSLYDEELVDAIPTRDSMERTARPLVDAVLAWADREGSRGGDLRGGGEGAERAAPLFLWVHFIDPHGPYTPPGFQPAASDAGGEAGRTLPVSESNEGSGVIPAYQALPGVTSLDEYAARYDAEVEHMDRELARLMSGLRDDGLLRDSIFVFTADHGESLGDHDLWFQHGSSLYDSQIRVPLLISGPRSVPSQPAASVSLIDVVPTILEMIGLPIHEGIQGRSLLPMLAEDGERGASSGRVIHAELDRLYASIRGGEKLIWDTAGGRVEIYETGADPEELRDLAGAGVPSRAELMKAAAEFARINTRDLPMETDEETLRVLRSLGYVDGS